MTDGRSRAQRTAGRLRRMLSRPAPAGGAPARPARQCPAAPTARPVVTVSGRLRTVRAGTVGGSPALTAELDDGSAVLSVVWLGRRAVPGIEPGRRLSVSGRLAPAAGRAVLYNPRYELMTTFRNGAAG